MTGLAIKQKIHRFRDISNKVLLVWFVTAAAVAAGVIILGLELTSRQPQAFNSPNDPILSDITDFREIAECLSVPWSEQNRCFDNFVRAFAGNRDTRELLRELEAARSASLAIEDDCHPIAHAIGRWTYSKQGNVGDAFEACDFTCHSGCYHGVMERVFFSEEELASDLQHLSLDELRSKLPGICNAESFTNPTRSIIFQCLHGVGHAVMFSLNYKLEDALAACDLFESSYEQSSCYGGVIMENITAFQKDKRDIKSGDPHYPCNKLDERYKRDCYMMQTSIMFELGMSEEKIAAACNDAPATSRDACFTSLGRDLSNIVRTGRPEHVAEVCEVHAGAYGYARECIAGAAYALIDNTWSGEYSSKFCNRLSLPNQTICYDLASNYLRGTYQKTSDEIRSDCDQFAGENIELCRRSVI